MKLKMFWLQTPAEPILFSVVKSTKQNLGNVPKELVLNIWILEGKEAG